jgi:YegS/Rv2252/BmrU family lipid kinase
MSAFPRALFIANPGARQVSSQPDLPGQAQRCLAGHGIEADLLITGGPGEAQHMARRAATQGYDLVVAAGGDGTVNEVVNGLAGSDTALGLIPLGTGNVLGSYLGLPAGDLEAACRLIAEGALRTIDLGCANGRHFVTMAGCGLDAQVAADTDSMWKSWLGKLAFVGQFMETLAWLRPWPYRATIDGRTLDGRMWAVFICNTAQYAWRVRLVPEAREDDGELDIVILRDCRRDELQREANAVFFAGEPARSQPHMDVFRGREVLVRCEPPAPWQVDGEVLGTTPLRCTVEPQMLKLVAPAKARP